MSRFIPNVSRCRSTFAVLAAAGGLASLASLAPAGPAGAAQPSLAAPQMTVYYSVRDLATEQGTRALYQRIVSAARGVCPEYDARDLDTFSYSRACQREAVARAVRQIGNPHLAALYRRAVRAAG